MFEFLNRTFKDKRLGIALGGGGARGLAHIGFLKVLADLDITPQIVSGTSIGALIGALYCSGYTPYEIEDLQNKVSILDWHKFIDLSIPAIHGLIKGERIIRTLRDEYKLSTFENLKIPMKIVATDFWNREEVVFDQGDLVKAIRASISIPGIFEAVKIGNRILTDGGSVNPVPYDIIRNDCDLLIAVDVTGEQLPKDHKHHLPGISECIINSFHIMESELLRNKLEESSPDFLYQPSIINVSIIDFTKYDEIIKQSQPEFDKFRKDMLNFKARYHKIV